MKNKFEKDLIEIYLPELLENSILFPSAKV
jgi:hypothetical protein